MNYLTLFISPAQCSNGSRWNFQPTAMQAHNRREKCMTLPVDYLILRAIKAWPLLVTRYMNIWTRFSLWFALWSLLAHFVEWWSCAQELHQDEGSFFKLLMNITEKENKEVVWSLQWSQTCAMRRAAWVCSEKVIIFNEQRQRRWKLSANSQTMSNVKRETLWKKILIHKWISHIHFPLQNIRSLIPICKYFSGFFFQMWSNIDQQALRGHKSEIGMSETVAEYIRLGDQKQTNFMRNLELCTACQVMLVIKITDLWMDRKRKKHQKVKNRDSIF